MSELNSSNNAVAIKWKTGNTRGVMVTVVGDRHGKFKS